MISCHSSAGRASQGGHARLTGRSAGSHCRGRAGVLWGGSRGGTCSHEPPQWALQGVLGAPLPTGGCSALWGYPGGARGRGQCRGSEQAFSPLEAILASSCSL